MAWESSNISYPNLLFIYRCIILKALISKGVKFEFLQSAVSFLSQRLDDDLIIISEYEGPLSVLGFYSSYDGISSYRRFTGGPNYMGDSPLYIAVLERYNGRLSDYIVILTSRLKDMGLNFEDGYITGSYRGVLGVTKLGDVILSEVFLDRASYSDIQDTLLEVFDVSIVDSEYDYTRFIQFGWRYRGMNWLGYRYIDCPVEASYRGEGGFYIRFGLTFHDRYVKRGFLEGSFYASPPHAPYSLLAYLRGVHVDELIFYQFKFGWRNIDVYGLETSVIEGLIDRLYEEALKYTENL